MGDADEALRTLTELADAGADVALVLIGRSLAGTEGGLLDQVRRLHPHAKRALLVPFTAWTDPGTADAIREAMALGRIDHYVLAPGGAPDEVFHEAVSSFLLEWARDRRSVPHTVHIVGESWSGRAFKLRSTFEMCAVPHTFCLADSEEGRRLLAEAGPVGALPVMMLPDGRVLSDPSDAEIAEAAGAPARLRARRLRPRHRRRRAGGSLRGGLRSLGRTADARRRRGRNRRTGEVELAHPELPGLLEGHQRQPARRAGLRAGAGLRGKLRVHAPRDRSEPHR